MDMHELMKEINDPNSQYYVPKEDFEFIPVKGTKAGVKSRNGHLVPILCRNLSVVKNMEVREDDTFVITFPKSGTHWIGEICWLIQNNLDFERAQKDSYMKRCPFIDVGIPDGILKKVPSPRVFRTHLQHELLPHDLHRKSKIVYAVRNPKDVLVSLYYFLQTIPQDEYEGSFEDLFNSFIEGKHMCGPWWEHVNTFTRLENVYVVHYEDMIKDAVNEVRSLAKFLGKELNDEQIKSIVDFSSFDKLKERIGQDMRIPPNFLKFVDAIPDPNAKPNDDQSNSNNQPPIPKRPVMLFRKGVIGDWKNHLSEDMSKMLDDIVKHKVNYPKPFIYEHS